VGKDRKRRAAELGAHVRAQSQDDAQRLASGAALPRRQRAGRIVNVGALAALKAGAGMGPYAASKSGVHRFTESLAEEFKGRSVTVNAVLPSTIDTPANRTSMPDAISASGSRRATSPP